MHFRNKPRDPNEVDQTAESREVPYWVKVIAGVAGIGCLTALFFVLLFGRPHLPNKNNGFTSSSSAVSEPASSEVQEPISEPTIEVPVISEPESEASSESEDTEEAASSTASKPSGTAVKKPGSKKAAAQQPAVEPRMKQKTETWADCPIEPDENGYYGVLYAPAINTEEPIFFGDEKKFLDAGWGQQTDTFLVGYECAHLFWSNNEQCVQEMQWMYPGLRFQIETDSGIYVYEVEVYSNGHWAVNPDRRDVTEYKIYNNNKEELANIDTTYDVLYLAHEKADGSVDVVEAHLVI